MGRISKSYSLILIVCLLVSSLIMIKLAFATSITKPSVPQFTLKVIGVSEVQITIQNQPLVLTMNNESLYYNVRIKAHSEENWTEQYAYNSLDDSTSKGTIPSQSNSQYTLLNCSVISYPENTQVDFQVEAMYGVYSVQEPASKDPFVPAFTEFSILADGESGWSNTQTISILVKVSLSPTPTCISPTSTPTLTSISNSELLLTTTITLVVIALLLAVITVLLILLMRKRKTII